MKKIKAISAVLLAMLMTYPVAVGIFAAATKTTAAKYADNADVKAYQASIAELEKKQSELKNKLKSVQSDRYSAQETLNSVNTLILNTEKKIETTQNLLDALEAQIATKQDEISVKEREISGKSAEAARTHEKFLQLLRAQYEGEDINILSVIFGADSLSDLLTRIEYMGNILTYNSKLLEKLTREKEELQALKASYEETKAELESNFAEQSKYSDQLLAEQANLLAQRGDSVGYLNSLKKTEAEITAEYEAARREEEKENARLENLLKTLANQDKTEYVGGKFIWPVDISIKRISSPYGYRTYYYYGKKVSDFHTGVDIPAAVGTDIYAVQDGKVVVATSHYSYGNYIVVDHGGGISTLYAHCSKLLVGVGDTVKQGDHIAEMGSTGNSTGSHLHIEVRVNGKHQDPIANGWLVQPK
ncbi:MAG: peptidoglycan DD-metalloendopeptidase family protein [Clostridia bacterium]|nr:peptidoglycan DD-metalloendopeptidase family protein [Clostridia bacterium]